MKAYFLLATILLFSKAFGQYSPILCPENQESVDGSCQCISGFTKYDGLNCIKKCPVNGYWGGVQLGCVCNWGLTKVGEECLLICDKPHQKKNDAGTQCICQDGFIKYDGTNCEKCPEKGYWGGIGIGCVCNWGLTMIDDKCQLICQQPNQKKNQLETGCICEDGYTKFDGNNCEKCPDFGYWGGFGIGCICNYNYQSIVIGDQTFCIFSCDQDNEEVPNAENNGCVCRPGYLKLGFSNDCVFCPDPDLYNPLTYECDCDSGYQPDYAQGTCVHSYSP